MGAARGTAKIVNGAAQGTAHVVKAVAANHRVAGELTMGNGCRAQVQQRTAANGKRIRGRAMCCLIVAERIVIEGQCGTGFVIDTAAAAGGVHAAVGVDHAVCQRGNRALALAMGDRQAGNGHGIWPADVKDPADCCCR